MRVFTSISPRSLADHADVTDASRCAEVDSFAHAFALSSTVARPMAMSTHLSNVDQLKWRARAHDDDYRGNCKPPNARGHHAGQRVAHEQIRNIAAVAHSLPSVAALLERSASSGSEVPEHVRARPGSELASQLQRRSEHTPSSNWGRRSAFDSSALDDNSASSQSSHASTRGTADHSWSSSSDSTRLASSTRDHSCKAHLQRDAQSYSQLKRELWVVDGTVRARSPTLLPALSTHSRCSHRDSDGSSAHVAQPGVGSGHSLHLADTIGGSSGSAYAQRMRMQLQTQRHEVRDRERSSAIRSKTPDAISGKTTDATLLFLCDGSQQHNDDTTWSTSHSTNFSYSHSSSSSNSGSSSRGDRKRLRDDDADVAAPIAPTRPKTSRYLREIDRRVILARIAAGEKQSTLAKEFQVSRAAICNLNKHRDQVLARAGENPLAKHPKRPRVGTKSNNLASIPSLKRISSSIVSSSIVSSSDNGRRHLLQTDEALYTPAWRSVETLVQTRWQSYPTATPADSASGTSICSPLHRLVALERHHHRRCQLDQRQE